MKTSTKWILGIVIGLVVGCIFLVLIGGAGYWAVSRFGGMGWEMGARSGRLWGNEGGLAPWQGMPMHAYPGHFGFFSPLRWIAFPLLCLGFLTLLVLGIVALVRSQRRPQQVAAAPVATPVEAAEAPVEVVQAPVRNCPNCGREVQADWQNCPYCGAPLT
jgi:hypothetical protein